MASTYTPLGIELQATGEMRERGEQKQILTYRFLNKYLVAILHKPYLILVIQLYLYLMDQLVQRFLIEL